MVREASAMTGLNARGLAVVRCGDNSLHLSWAEQSSSFDVAISYFGSDEQKQFPEAKFIHRKKAGKWDGIFDFFAEFPETIAAYDYYWFPDDDIQIDAADADQLLTIGDDYNLDLFQPALDADSYFTHLITLGLSDCTLRYTNFAEIMVPVLSQRLFKKALPTMDGTRSGFGLDYLWAQMAQDMNGGRRNNIAIIDKITITHTRPVGKVLQSFVAAQGGRTGREEFSEVLKHVKHRNPLFRSLDLAVPRKRIFAALRSDGKLIPRLFLPIKILSSLIFNYRNRVQPIRRFRAFLLSITAVL
jgi:Protein of unknown function (DUF707)